jgi:hypothetical protein
MDKHKNKILLLVMISILVLVSWFVYFQQKNSFNKKEKVYQITEVEENQKLVGKEIKVQAVVFLVSEIDKSIFYVVDLSLADKLNSPECGIYNMPVFFQGLQPKPKSKIEMVGKVSGLFSNGTIKFNASKVKQLE